MNKTEADLINSKKNPKDGTHEVMINQIGVYLQSIGKDDRPFNTNIVSLKKLRVRADYKNEQIDIVIGSKSIQLCGTIIADLKSKVKI
jgi:hypothetical protein